MPQTPRVVLDTNILVSATLVTRGFPAQIMGAALDRRIGLVVSPFVIAEYLDVLQRPHIVRKYPQLAARAEICARYLRTRAKVVEPTVIERIVPEDPKDDAILACAKAAKANYIVSGDEHLLRLRGYRGIQILTPRAFVETVLREKIR